MAVTAHDVQTLHEYAGGVMDRAVHHAGHVRAIVLALIGGVIWRADPGSIEIKQYDGDLANVLWFAVANHRYAFAYNHKNGKIEIRDRTQSGSALHIFDNHTPITDVERIFATL